MAATALAGCASGGDSYSAMPAAAPRRPALVLETPGQKLLQCVPYARDHSDVKIFGAAWTWWDKATGKYPQGASPQDGAVMVLTNYAGPQHGHVAVVRRIVSPREIRVDHANWLSNGAIYINNPVQDVSPANDWSQVRVYNITAGTWGTKVYPVQGFIGGEGGAPPAREDTLMARRDDAVEERAVAQAPAPRQAPRAAHRNEKLPADEEWAEEPEQVYPDETSISDLMARVDIPLKGN